MKLSLLKEIANKISSNELSKLPESISKIIRTLFINYVPQTSDCKQDIQKILGEKGNNIMNFSKFVDNEINPKQIDNLLTHMGEKDNSEIKIIINKLSKYENELELFNKEFSNALKNSIFEFSLVSAVLIERNDFERFTQEKAKCPNRVDRVLFHGSNPAVISSILTGFFKKSTERNSQHGKGVYFTDLIDFCWFYGNSSNNRVNFNKIPFQGEEFTLIACSIYYDKYHFNKGYDYKYTPKKNEINFAYVDTDSNILHKFEEHKIFFTEYVIFDLDQIYPFISIKLKREEFCVIWRENI